MRWCGEDLLVFEAFWAGLTSLLSWSIFGFIILGCSLGIVFGAIPGLTGIIVIALMLPFIWTMEPIMAVPFILAILASVHTSNTFPAVLFNVPGSPSAAATILDGYPMAKKGEAARALSAAFMASVMGGLFGAIFLAFVIPVIRPLVLMFASPERFILVLMGIVMIGVLGSKQRTKGLLAGALGLLISTIGMDPQEGIPRYAFGQDYLLYGISLVPLTLGLFCLPEVIELARRGRIAGREIEKIEMGTGFRQGIKDGFHHWFLVLRSSAIGVFGGAIPGIGGTASAFYAYGYAVQGSKSKADFGKGDVRGVIAPESANNSSTGGELIPTLAFGIPGGASTAMLLVAFLILGVQPGPSMLTTHLSFTFSMVWTVVIANLITCGVCLLLVKPIARLTTVRGELLIPFILLFVLFGSYIQTVTVMDLVVTSSFGVLGYVMMRSQWPRAPLLVGFILGTLAERFLYISYASYGPLFFLRPVSLILTLLLLAILVFAFVSPRRRREGEG
ncbi:tripartite tricarboxylate transporter permease [Chloroflexota bacterium]